MANETGERLVVSTKDIANLLTMSEDWVRTNRCRMIGAQKIGGRWRYDVAKIRGCIATGKDIIIK